MRFAILGPLRAYVDDREVVVGAPRERVALAALLLRAGETVPMAHLVDVIWPDAPPHTARNQVQLCVSRLRRRLTTADTPDAAIVTELGGYRLRVARSDVDVHQFRALIAAARTAASEGNPKQATERYRTALSLWRGPALLGLESSELRGVANALEEDRIRALEECLGLELQLGADGSLVAELTELVRQHPYREGLRATLMRALYRSGRPAEALGEYQSVRVLLRDELGTEPGEELRRLHKAILNRDPSLDPPASQPIDPAPAVRELPAEPSRFVGRSQEMAEVRAALVTADRNARRPTVVVIYGPGGVGKSALAVRTSHDLATEFPDGQLYVDLCGSTPWLRPLTATEVLGRFLRRLGIPPEQIPSEEAEAAALYRSAIADRRLLLLLDNAGGTGQILPLIPASASCAVLVTSRYPLASLDADDRLRLGVLGDAEGLALLTGLTGRLTAEPEAVRSILALSGGLPLAIRIAAGRLACRPDLSAAEYAQRLADRSRRLDELQLDDLAVRASIRTSYDELLSSGDPAGAVAARAFRMLGLLHVPDVAPGVVAAMLPEPDPEIARSALDRLVDAQLLEPFGEGRYRLHDLVRLVAAERATAEDLPATRDQSLVRALGYYAATLSLADAQIQSLRTRPFGKSPSLEGVWLPAFDGAVEARSWIDEELHCLLSMLDQSLSRTRSVSDLLAPFAEVVWRALEARCEWGSACNVSLQLVATARDLEDPLSGACGLLLLGRSEACLGRHESAMMHLEWALLALQELDNQAGVAVTLNGLGLAAVWAGDPVAAQSWFAKGLEVAQRNRMTGLVAVLLSNMVVSYAMLGKLDDALGSARKSTSICAEINDLHTLGSAMINMAGMHCLVGDYDEAIRSADRALALGRDVGRRIVECESLIIRSEARRRAGDHRAAANDAQAALLSSRTSGYQYAAAAAKRQQARILAAAGYESEAVMAHRQADSAYARLTQSYRDPLLELLLHT
jgi:DNA-binding SARP family transcriptional activator